MISRKEFLKQLAVIGVAANISLLYTCNDKKTVVIPANFAPLSKDYAKILAYTIEILFPEEGNGPSVQQLNTLEYILWNLNDKNRDSESNEYIVKGIKWLEETANEEKEKSFLDLTDNEKEFVIEFVSKKSWGEDWLSTILTLIFESLLYDPIYNINKKEIGWNWLNHKAGIPRPNNDTKYIAKI